MQGSKEERKGKVEEKSEEENKESRKEVKNQGWKESERRKQVNKKR